MPASRFEDIDAIYVGNFGGFEKQSFPAAFALDADPDLALQAGDAGRECLRHRHRPPSTPRDNAIEARAARFVLVIGAEKMTVAPGDADRRHPAQCLLSHARKATRRAALPAFSGASPNSISSAMATSRRRSP